MQLLKRRILWTLLALIPIVCALAIGGRAYHDITQAPLNHALIEAIKRDDAQGVAYSLAHGADANARDEPNNNLTFWQWLKAFWHGGKKVDPNLSSALQIAVQHDFEEDPPMLPEKSFTILKALHDAGAVAEGDTPKFLPEAKAYAKTMATFPDALVEGNECSSLNCEPYHAEKFLLDYGLSASAYAAIGQSRLRDDDYPGAIHAYRVAQLWRPNDARIRQGLTQAQDSQRVSDDISRQLPHDNKALCVRSYPDEQGRHLWVVVCGTGKMGAYGSLKAAVALYEEKDRRYMRLCEAVPFVDVSVELSIVRATGRRLPEIVVRERSYGAGWAYAKIYIYEVKPGRLHPILSSIDDSWPSLVDLRHDGHYQVRVGYPQNGAYAISNVRRTPHYYAFNGSEYVFDDRAHPEGFQNYMQQAQKLLTKNPGYYGLYNSIGYVYSIQRNTQKADEYYRKAAQVCREDIANEQHSCIIPLLRKRLKQILAREPFPDF